MMVSKVSLGEVCDIISGATPKTENAKFWGGDVPWATPKDISDLESPYLEAPSRSITKEGLKSCATRVLPVNSVLLSSRAPIGLVAINTIPVATNQGFKNLVPSPSKLESKFLYYWLKSKTDYLQSLGNGATFKEISKAVVERIEIPLPPLDEQRRIAAILDRADALRRKRKRALHLLDGLTQSIFLDMFGDLLKSQRFERGPISRWVADFETGKNLAPDPDAAAPNAFQVLKVSAVTQGWFDSSETKPLPLTYVPPSHHLVREGDLLFSRANTSELIGAVAYVGSQAKRLVLPDKIWRFCWHATNQPHPLFIHALFSTPKFRREISKRSTGTSGSMKNISKAKVLSIQVAQPTRAQQEEFVERARAVATARSKSLEQDVLIDAQFASLQHRAFSGQL